jgi:hypothetical protein
MLSVIEQAQAYLVKTANLAREAVAPLWKGLDPEVQKEASRLRKESFFVEENRLPEKQVEHLSPEGDYKLVIDYYGTGKGTWNYSRGRVYHHNGSNPIADVKRNYSSFFFAFIRPGGGDNDDYLVCGADYQGQTFINLGTGKRRDLMSDGSEKGFGFCWAAYELMPDGVTLKVDGCYWACPYEYKFFDVSDPIGKGWPELGLPEGVDCLDEGENTSLDYEDGLFVWRDSDYVFKATGERNSEIESQWSRLFSAKHKAERLEEGEEVVTAAQAAIDAHEARYPDHEDEPDLWNKVVDHSIKFRNDGGTLVLVEEWKSDHLLAREKHGQEWREKAKAQRQEWKAKDPLLQALGEITDLDGLVGFMYPSQVMKWDGDKNPAYFTVSAAKYDSDNPRNHTATLKWGVVEGPLAVELWVRGKGNTSKPEFPRTVEGLQQAWAAAQDHLTSEAR